MIELGISENILNPVDHHWRTQTLVRLNLLNQLIVLLHAYKVASHRLGVDVDLRNLSHDVGLLCS